MKQHPANATPDWSDCGPDTASTPTPTAPRELKTAEQVKAEFAQRGISVAQWARVHKVHRQLVYEILRCKYRQCSRGDSHRIAVLLGLKAGELASVQSVNAVPDRIAA